MKAKHPVKIKNSVSTELFRKVFLLYVAIATITTIFHMAFELYTTKNDIKKELATISKSLERGISTALWNIHNEQLTSIAVGTYNLPIINGLRIIDNKGDDVTFMGEVSKFNVSGAENSSYGTKLHYKDEEGTFYVGEMILYPNPDAAFERVKLGFLLILINALIKSTALWLLFLYFFRKYLGNPLADITDLIRNVNTSNFREPTRTIETAENNELSLLKNTFDYMIKELSSNHQELKSYADDLEAKVKERTIDLDNALTSKAEFMSDISHELRTPMSFTMLQVEAMDQGISNKSANPKAILSTLRQMDRVIDDLSTFASLESKTYKLDCEEVDLNSEVSGAVEKYSDLADEKGLKVSVSCCESLPVVFADKIRLAQVLSNLLTNSIKYTDATGIIKIKTECLDNRKVLISVSDSSPGVKDDQLSCLTNRFYRVHSDRNKTIAGTGLGLSICKLLIEAIGGKFFLKHSPEGGLLVEVEFRVVEGEYESNTNY